MAGDSGLDQNTLYSISIKCYFWISMTPHGLKENAEKRQS